VAEGDLTVDVGVDLTATGEEFKVVFSNRI
jgi:hypothetical protein